MKPLKLAKTLGRNAKPDARDHKFLIKNHFTLAPTRVTQKYWDPNGWWGNQGSSPMCVGYAWAHWIEDGPVDHGGIAPIMPPQTIYEQAQFVDEWPGEDYEGTSVRGGVKYLQSASFVKSYYWAFDINTIVQYILTYGPMVVGTDWYTSMFYPDRTGMIRTTGRLAGGHAYVLNGVDTIARKFRIKNSWGKSWGKGGMAYISFNDMAKLIANQGEACIAVETPDSQLVRV